MLKYLWPKIVILVKKKLDAEIKQLTAENETLKAEKQNLERSFRRYLAQ